VSAKNTRGLTPLHLAASRGHISVAHLLVSRGAYWNCRDNNGTSPFHIACGAGRVEFMGYLMVCNCGVDARTNSGDTALHMACFSGSMDAAEILVNQIPRLLNSRNYIGDTPCDTCHNQ
ncbi:ankrd52, partial [Symbiodinium microadriaticum]